MNNPDLYNQIRTKKLGLLIFDARQASGKSLSECALESGISLNRLKAIETGNESPTLPEVEIFAYLYKLPLEHFWGQKVLSESEEKNQPSKFQQLISIRNRLIGTNIKNKISERGISENDFAQKVEIPLEDFQAYQTGEIEIPVPILERIAKGLDMRIEDFFDTHGIIGQWRKELATSQKIKEMPVELLEFVSKPINIPFIELAIRLSELDVNRLRSVAEGLLEITL